MKKQNLNQNRFVFKSSTLSKLLTAACLFGALAAENAEALVATNNCRDLSLSFTPYLSSYLPKLQGPLTNLRGDEKSLADLSSPATSQQLEIFKNTSVMQRLDRLNQIYLGKTTNYQAQTQASHYDRKAQGWAGFCNVWAAASSNPEINRFLQEVGDVKCGDVLISKGEIREVITGFSQDQDSGIFGLRSISERSPETHTFRNRSGYDDLSAAVFDEKLRTQLGQNLGLVMDLDPGPEVWNHPIFKSHRCEERVTDISNYASNELNVPPRLLVSSNPQVMQFLKLVNDADALAQEKKYKEAVTVLQQALRGQTFNNEFAAPAGHFFDRDYNYVRPRAGEALEWLRRQRLVTLNPNYSYSLVSNTILYRIEPDYAMGTVADKGYDFTRQKTLTYVLVAGPQNQVADQFWISEADKRPDTIFTPVRIQDVRGQSEILRDFVDAVRKCRGQ